MKYKEKYTTRRYTNETIQEVISFSISVLSNFVKIGKNLNVLVFEKPNIRECNNGEYKSKDGIHIVFPDIKQNKKIYNKFVEQFLQEENVD